MRKNIKEIFYMKRGAFNRSEYLKIEIKECTNLIKYSLNDSSKILETDNSKLDIFIERLFRTIATWENKYISNNVNDGTAWQLKIIYKDDSQKNYLGKNLFPNNFENFNKIKNELIK